MEDDILSPEQAFQVSAESLDGNTLKVRWTIADGTYLYQDKLKVELVADGVQLGQYEMPTPDIKKDSVKPDGTFGDVPVYHNEVTLEIPLLRGNTEATDIEVKTAYQGCADRGICYPPQKSTLKVALPAAGGATAVAAAPAPQTAPAGDAPVNEQDQLLGDLQTASPLFGLLLSLGFGILVAFTACMYPMIPILSSLIMGQGDKITAFRSFELSLAYTQGIALTFGAIGAGIALFGQGINIQSALQTPWVLVPSAILFIGLALSMFGFYQIQMPSAIQSRLHEMSNNQKGGSALGVFMMGVLSALIVGPCGGPVLLAVLAFAAQTQDALLGFLFLWVFGTGMGLPLLVMGSGGGALLPKAGTWMDTVKATGGVIMLALAISFLERLSPTYIAYSTIMLMWGTLLIVAGVYMGALRQLPEEVSGWSKLWKGLGLVILIYGALFLVGVAAGGKDTWQPLKGIAVGGGHAAAEQQHAQFTRVKTIEDLEREVAAAKAAGKPVMLDFYADWCTYCKTMEKEIFPHPKVVAALDGFVLLQADITRQDDDDIALSKHLDMPAPPALYFWDSNGQEMRSHRIVGNVTAEQLASRASTVAQGAK
jgi:thiol:disulfide interchange protein DsbD